MENKNGPHFLFFLGANSGEVQMRQAHLLAEIGSWAHELGGALVSVCRYHGYHGTWGEGEEGERALIEPLLSP